LSKVHPPARGLEFHSADGVGLSGIWFPADGRNGVVLYCHGNAGNLSHRGEVVEVWRDQLNFSVFLFDYRGYGQSEGSPTEEGIYLDTVAAYQQVRKLSDQLPIVVGRSLGTVVATRLAGSYPVRALLLDSPLASASAMASHMFGIPGLGLLIRHRLDNVRMIRKMDRPLLILHGERDSLVPMSQAREVFTSARGKKEFLVLAGQGHNEPRDQPEVVSKLRDFVDRLP
jgi:fermentation-respiration switch protein FrsA (DUF1100 family)